MQRPQVTSDLEEKLNDRLLLRLRVDVQTLSFEEKVSVLIDELDKSYQPRPSLRRIPRKVVVKEGGNAKAFHAPRSPDSAMPACPPRSQANYRLKDYEAIKTHYSACERCFDASAEKPTGNP